MKHVDGPTKPALMAVLFLSSFLLITLSVGSKAAKLQAGHFAKTPSIFPKNLGGVTCCMQEGVDRPSLNAAIEIGCKSD